MPGLGQVDPEIGVNLSVVNGEPQARKFIEIRYSKFRRWPHRFTARHGRQGFLTLELSYHRNGMLAATLDDGLCRQPDDQHRGVMPATREASYPLT